MSDPRDDLAALISEALDHDYEPPVIRMDYMTPFGAFYQAADAVIAAGYSKPKPPTVTPDHDIDAISSHLCAACGRGIEWDDNTEEWVH